MAEITITRPEGTITLDIESLADAKLLMSLLNTKTERQKVIAQAAAFFKDV